MQQQSAMIIVLNPRPGDVSLPEQCSRTGKCCSGSSPTPPGGSMAAMSEGSSSIHILPSPPPPLPLTLLGVILRCPRFEMRVIPHTVAMDTTEEEISNALVIVIGDTRPAVTPAHVLLYLTRFFQVRD
jgi:hypothetical protein